MASAITKKPYVGFATGIIFGFLGMLLFHIDAAPGIALWMFRIVGIFLLFVALSSVVTALYVLRRNSEMKRGRGER
jgi:multisubunit Na+/H+ antiporter MnhE subunit